MGTRPVVVELEGAVADLLQQCESKIEQALDSAHHALKQIHDDKLYKASGYSSFELYCEKRWGYSKSHAYRLIDHARIIDQLKSEGVDFLPAGEGLTRPIQKLRRLSRNEDDFMQRAVEAWTIAKDTAPKVLDVPQVTVSHVESTMQRMGLYRNAKKVSPDAPANELRELLTKLFQSDAFKTDPVDFAGSFGSRAIPSQFYDRLSWLNAFAEALGGEEG